MFPREICDAALAQLDPTERQQLQQEARKLGCDMRGALLAKAMDNLQRQLVELSRGCSAKGQLKLVKGP